jgi:hypothetical protein
VKSISKDLGYRNNSGDTDTVMYPEVHALASATLRWSGVEAQDIPRTTKALPYYPQAFPPKGKPLIY